MLRGSSTKLAHCGTPRATPSLVGVGPAMSRRRRHTPVGSPPATTAATAACSFAACATTPLSVKSININTSATRVDFQGCSRLNRHGILSDRRTRCSSWRGSRGRTSSKRGATGIVTGSTAISSNSINVDSRVQPEGKWPLWDDDAYVVLERISGAGVVSGGRSYSGSRRNKSTVAMPKEKDGDDARELQSLRDGTSEAACGAGGKLRNFLLTDIGEGIMEVEILQWFVSPGDHVRQFDKLCEVQSDKANVEITSRFEGVVRKVHHAVGEMAQTGCVLVDIEEAPVAAGIPRPSPPLSSAEEPLPSTLFSSTATVPPRGVSGDTVEGRGGGRDGAGKKQVLATPSVRRLCRDLNLDMSIIAITGSGPEGRVLKGDILAYAAAAGIPWPARELAGPAAAGIESNDGEGVEEAESKGERTRDHVVEGSEYAHTAMRSASTNLGGIWGSPESAREGSMILPEGEVRAAGGVATTTEGREERTRVNETRREVMRSPIAVPIKGVQKAMMEAMRKSLEVPHMTLCDEITADKLSRLRSDMKDEAERRDVKLSYLPLLIKATSMALSVYPSLNASLSECQSQLLQHPDHNIGVAMDTDKGLLVPNISCVQERSILNIAEELNTLQRLGAAGKLGETELTGTTFTLSNIGSIGGTYTSPIILHPQVCIGALGRMQRVPRLDSQYPNKVVGVSTIPVSWSADHRVIDGGTLARFSNLWKTYLENPARMLADTR